MAALTIQKVAESGLTASYASVTASDTVVNNGNIFIHVKNGGGGSTTVTITAQKTKADNSSFGKLTKSNATKAIASGAEAFIGPFSPAFNNSSGNIVITYSVTTSVTIAALEL